MYTKKTIENGNVKVEITVKNCDKVMTMTNHSYNKIIMSMSLASQYCKGEDCSMCPLRVLPFTEHQCNNDIFTTLGYMIYQRLYDEVSYEQYMETVAIVRECIQKGLDSEETINRVSEKTAVLFIDYDDDPKLKGLREDTYEPEYIDIPEEYYGNEPYLNKRD